MTESTLRSFSSSGRGVDLIPLGDKRKFEEGGVSGGNRCEAHPEAVNSGVLGLISEGKSVVNCSVFDDFQKKHQKIPSTGGQKASVFDVFGLQNAISS